jgi:hypothetical protein
MIDPKVLKLERNYLTNYESKFKGTSNQDVPFFFFWYVSSHMKPLSILFQTTHTVHLFLKVSDLIGEKASSFAVVAVGAGEVMRVLLWVAYATHVKVSLLIEILAIFV